TCARRRSSVVTAGAAVTFTVGGQVLPPPTLSRSGTLPDGVSFTDNGDGTATLAGMPSAGMGGTYPLTITAQNGIVPDAVQSFTLTVNEAPSISSASSATFTVRTAATFT